MFRFPRVTGYMHDTYEFLMMHAVHGQVSGRFICAGGARAPRPRRPAARTPDPGGRAAPPRGDRADAVDAAPPPAPPRPAPEAPRAAVCPVPAPGAGAPPRPAGPGAPGAADASDCADK